jgi:hypothetical protein
MRSNADKKGPGKDEFERWEKYLKYKKFSKDDLLGNSMSSIFTNSSGSIIFEKVWGHLE